MTTKEAEKMIELKQKLEEIEKEEQKILIDFSSFGGAGIATVTVPNKIGKKMKLEQRYVGLSRKYVLYSINSNGRIGEVEDKIRKNIENIEGVYMSTYLT